MEIGCSASLYSVAGQQSKVCARFAGTTLTAAKKGLTRVLIFLVFPPGRGFQRLVFGIESSDSSGAERVCEELASGAEIPSCATLFVNPTLPDFV